ncbi:MAG: hypothetical protein HY064_06880 [Bacteroidetes bacterium]|nr:hypothetical protein [Bacteroidota bacterium]
MKKTGNKKTTTPLSKGGFFLVLFFLFMLHSSITTSTTKNILITATYDQQAATNHIVHLNKMIFINGIPGGEEKIMDVITQTDDDNLPRIRFDLGPNQIYRDRYIITSYGNVIDMQEKKVLVDSHDQFMKASGDSLIFYTNDIFRGEFYSVLNLRTGNYFQVKNPAFKVKTGQDVEADCTLKNYKIYLYPPSAEKIELVRDAGYGEDVSLIPGAHHQCPIFWIDHDDFLYPNYSAQHDFVSINKVNVSSGTEEKIGEIDQLPENHSLSRFYKSPEGTIVYECSRGNFGIDYAKKKILELQFLSAGNDFSISVNEHDGKGRDVRNGENVIGTYFCDPATAVSTKGLIAFPYEIVLANEHYLQGYMVWSSATTKWQSFGDSDLCAVIGWTEE